MEKVKARTNVIVINQANHSPQDAVDLGKGVIGYSITCPKQSGNNAWVGINQPANKGHVLTPGDSKPYGGNENIELKDKLYIKFDPDSSAGICIVTIINDINC